MRWVVRRKENKVKTAGSLNLIVQKIYYFKIETVGLSRLYIPSIPLCNNRQLVCCCS